MSFGHDDQGSWTLSAKLPADEGALVERALRASREELFRAGEHASGPHPAPSDVSWADALVAVADRSLAPGAHAVPTTTVTWCCSTWKPGPTEPPAATSTSAPG